MHVLPACLLGWGGVEPSEIVFVSILFPPEWLCVCVCVRGGLYACMCNKSALIRCERGEENFSSPKFLAEEM